MFCPMMSSQSLAPCEEEKYKYEKILTIRYFFGQNTIQNHKYIPYIVEKKGGYK